MTSDDVAAGGVRRHVRPVYGAGQWLYHHPMDKTNTAMRRTRHRWTTGEKRAFARLVVTGETDAGNLLRRFNAATGGRFTLSQLRGRLSKNGRFTKLPSYADLASSFYTSMLRTVSSPSALTASGLVRTALAVESAVAPLGFRFESLGDDGSIVIRPR